MCPRTATPRALVLAFAAWESAVLGYDGLRRLQPARLDGATAACGRHARP